MKVENAIYPQGEQVAETLTKGSSGPVVMVNLLKFKKKAEYKDGRAAADDGKTAYNRYGADMLRFVTENGGRVLFIGEVKSLVIGEVEDLWDAVALVEYPSSEAFLKIVTAPEVEKFAIHREAGLEGQLLIQTVQVAGV
jgi:uncharacterized protein (DUF1330 family)